MNASGIVTLTTDFGLRDPYAGIMHGVALTSNPGAQIVDITHSIPAHDIMNASFTIARAYNMFTEGTVHCAVVDPGVGGKRKNIAIRTNRYFFVGPDNGIFSIALTGENGAEIREITNPAFMRDIISHTFHGRDVYAPCAGALSKGLPFDETGPVLKNITMLAMPELAVDGDQMVGEVMTVDSFGNLVTNITESSFASFIGKRSFSVYFASERFTSIATNYEEVPARMPLVIFGSSGYMEISMSSANASNYYMSAAGSMVSIRRD